MNGFADWVIRYRWWIIVATFIGVVAAGAGMSRLEYSNNYRVFFSKENPQLLAFESLQNTYSKNDNVLFVVAPKDGKVFTRETLATIEWLTQEAWQTPYSSRVDSITNFQHTSARGDELIVQDLVSDAAHLSDDDLARVREIAVNEPLLANRLISPATHVTGLNVTLILPEKSLDEVPEVVAHVRGLAEQAKAQNPNLDIYLTGVVMMNNAFDEHARSDVMTLVPLMYGAIILIALVSLRSVMGTIATLLIIAFSIVTAMGLTGWLGIKLTPPTVSAPTVILTLAIADSIHVLLSMFFDMRRGLDKHAAIRQSMKINMQPVFLTSLTTVIGFLSMNFSEVPPFRDLGNVTAIGVIAAWVYSILFLPALMAVVPIRVPKARTRVGATMDRFSNFVIRRRRILLWGIGLFSIALLACIPRNELNDQFVQYFDESVDFRHDTDFAEANLTGMAQVSYSLGAGESGGISEPAYLKKVEEFAQWYRAQPHVTHVNTLTDTVRRLNKNMHGDNPEWYRLPKERDLIAQYLLLYELSLPFGLDLNDQINVDKSATRVAVTMKNISTKELLAMESRAQEWLRTNTPPSMHVDGTGPAIMFSHIGERNIRSMIKGNLIALVLVSAVIMIAIRSFKIGILSLLPNLIPAGLAFGMWGLLVGQVGLSLSIVTALTFGIIVDDTIHFLAKYLHARRDKGLGPEDAVRYAFATVGMALTVTSLILVAGFSVLALSSFELNSGMGLMAAATIAFALFADFLMLPPLLMKLEEKLNEKSSVSKLVTAAIDTSRPS